MWRSLAARGVWVAEVAGSNPAIPTDRRRRSTAARGREPAETVAAQHELRDLTVALLWRAMRLRSFCDDLPLGTVRRILSGLPEARGFDVVVRPLRYREKPHLAAQTDFGERTITLQVPEPFYPFGEGVTFRTAREVLRFLYLHEWMHWYLHVHHGRGGSAETTCDRFALLNYKRRVVTMADAEAALRRVPAEPSRPTGAAAPPPRTAGKPPRSPGVPIRGTRAPLGRGL